MIHLLAFIVVPQDASFADHFHPYVQGRVRAESTFDQTSGEDRHRGRLRLRVGSMVDIAENLTGEIRLSTASDGRDANNPHWDFGDGSDAFQGGDVVLDRFYVKWGCNESFDVRAGKMPHTFAAPPGYSELVWDQDVQPTGVSASWNPDFGDSPFGFGLQVAEYIAVENGSASDSAMFGVQANGSYDIGESSDVKAAVGYMDWSSLGAGAGVFGNQGNTNVAGDFAILDAFVSYGMDTEAVGRVEGSFEYMNNVDDDTGEDTGFAVGFGVGRSGKKGAVKGFLTYYDLDANAVFSPVAQDDTPIAGTGLAAVTDDGMSGFIGGVQYGLADNVDVRLWALTSDASDPGGNDPYRIRLDLNFTVK